MMTFIQGRFKCKCESSLLSFFLKEQEKLLIIMDNIKRIFNGCSCSSWRQVCTILEILFKNLMIQSMTNEKCLWNENQNPFYCMILFQTIYLLESWNWSYRPWFINPFAPLKHHYFQFHENGLWYKTDVGSIILSHGKFLSFSK